jgi:flagellar hook protein FlgE
LVSGAKQMSNIALTGIMASQKELGVISNNISNVSTNGYKKTSINFADIVGEAFANSVSETNSGSGVKTVNNRVLFSQGAVKTTSNSLDLALIGDAFFTKKMEQVDGISQFFLSRDGSVDLAKNGCLIDGSGCYLVDQYLNTIIIPETEEVQTTITTYTPNQASLDALLPNIPETTSLVGRSVVFNSLNSTSNIKFIDSEGISPTLGDISINDGSIYKGLGGGGAQQIGRLRSAEQGSGIKIDFFSDGIVELFENTDGEPIQIGEWQISNQRIITGQSEIDGYTVPIDDTYPALNDGTLDSTGNNLNFGVEIVRDSLTGNTLRLTNSGSVTSYGVLRGPSISSKYPQVLNAGQKLSIELRALSGADAYDAYGYLVDVDTGETVKIFDQTGSSTEDIQEWTTMTTVVPKGGNYKLFFVNGSYDSTGGSVVGSSLEIRNIDGFGDKSFAESVNRGVGKSADIKDLKALSAILQTSEQTETSLNMDVSKQKIKMAIFNPDGTSSISQSINLVASDSVIGGFVEYSLSDINVDQKGLVTAAYDGGRRLKNIASLGIALVIDKSQLQPNGMNNFVLKSGNIEQYVKTLTGEEQVSIQQRALELSNVDITEELTHLLMTQQIHQASSKAYETIKKAEKGVLDITL